MIFQTILPQEIVWADRDSSTDRRFFARYRGIPVLLEPAENGNYRICQLLSTDPDHFLDPSLAPGTLIYR